MKIKIKSSGCIAFLVGFSALQNAQGVVAAYVHILKNELAETRFHLSEVEVFSSLVVPDGLGGATFGGMSTSTNDIGDGILGAAGVGNFYPVLGTTNDIQHGATNQDPDNILQNAGAVWSTNTGLATESQYTLSLGGSFDVTTVRLWPRADGCCAERWRNLEIQLLDSNFDPIPETLNLATAPGGNVPLEFTFTSVPEPGSTALLGLASVLLLRRRR